MSEWNCDNCRSNCKEVVDSPCRIGLVDEGAKLQAALAKHRWIRVEERLPEKNEQYLVFNGNVAMIFKWFGKREQWGGIYSITHWKPIILPE